MQHSSNIDNGILRWQLLNNKHLTPLTYDLMVAFNQKDGSVQNASIRTDTLTGAPNVRIKELFWVGFGDLCYITDQMVEPINKLWKGIKEPVPTIAKRLPKWVLEKYFPIFNSGNFSGLSHTFEEVGDCNKRCLPLPKPTVMRDTEQGRIQFEAYRYDQGLDLSSLVRMAEDKYLKMWSDLNSSGYCSPYVTTY